MNREFYVFHLFLMNFYIYLKRHFSLKKIAWQMPNVKSYFLLTFGMSRPTGLIGLSQLKPSPSLKQCQSVGLDQNTLSNDMLYGTSLAKLYKVLPPSLMAILCCLFIMIGLGLASTQVLAANVNAQAISQDPETRLIEVQKLLAEGRLSIAKEKIEALIRDVPNFRAAHLIYGDILNIKNAPVTTVGDVPLAMSQSAANSLQGLRAETRVRVVGVKYLPPPNTVPSQLLNLSSFSRHAIVVDASKSRLYVFENDGKNIKLLNHFYTTMGKLGIGKVDEGDQKTPLGVYYISRTIAQDKLPTKYGPGYYGSGALTLTYPNPLDLRRGKTGSGIWIHGTPPTEFARFPKASDGCVVLANPDFEKVNKLINPKTTPVIITENISWVNPSILEPERRLFADTVQLWLAAKSSNQFDKLAWFYDSNFYNGKNLSDWKNALKEDQAKSQGKPNTVSDVSFVRWQDKDDIMVLTYNENSSFRKTSVTKRIYWIRVASQWKIFYEGVIG